MEQILITGCPGQAGMAIAQACLKKGWRVVLSGRRSLDRCPAWFQLFLREEKIPYLQVDIFSEAGINALKTLARESDYWFNAAEPYKSEKKFSEPEWKKKANQFFTFVLDSGFVMNSKKKFMRLGSPAAETWEECRFQKTFPGSIQLAEETPFAILQDDEACFQTDYFLMKRIFSEGAAHFFSTRGLNVISVCPGALIGPWGNRGDHEWLLNVAAQKFPFNFFLPSNMGNAVPLDVFGRTVIFLFDKGENGKWYHVPGWNVEGRKLFKMVLEEAKTKSLPFLPFSAKVPGPAAMSFLSHYFFNPLGIRPPFLFEPGIYAILNMTGTRHPALLSKMGFKEEVNEDSVREAIRDALKFYRETGQLKSGF